MSKTAVVTKAEYTGRTWTSSQYGDFHIHAIEFDNGDKGEYSSKAESQDKFVVGQSAEYDSKDGGNHADKIKPVAQQGGGGGGGRPFGPKHEDDRKSINACNALNNAVQLACHGVIDASKKGEVSQWADKFFIWLEGKQQP